MDPNFFAALITAIVGGIGAYVDYRKRTGKLATQRVQTYHQQAEQEPSLVIAGIAVGNVFQAQAVQAQLLQTIYNTTLVQGKKISDMETRLQEVETDNKHKDATIAQQNSKIERHEKRIKKLESLLNERGIPLPPDTDELPSLDDKTKLPDQ